MTLYYVRIRLRPTAASRVFQMEEERVRPTGSAHLSDVVSSSLPDGGSLLPFTEQDVLQRREKKASFPPWG